MGFHCSNRGCEKDPSFFRYSVLTVSSIFPWVSITPSSRTSSSPVLNRKGSIRSSLTGLSDSAPSSGRYISIESPEEKFPLMTTVPSGREIPRAIALFSFMMGSGENERAVLSYTSTT